MRILDPDPSGLFQSPSNSLRRLYLESSIRGQLDASDAPADVPVPPGLRFGVHEQNHGRAHEKPHGRARERGPVRAAETMAEPRPPNRPWSPRRSPRRDPRAGPLGVRASDLRRLQLDEYDAYSRARGAIASTGEALPRREGYRTHTSESFLMQAYPAWGYGEHWAPSPPSTTIRQW